jgi:hypothetical protein
MLDLFHVPEAGRFEPADDAVDKAASLLYYVWISGSKSTFWRSLDGS